jgi:hypothetical protein
LTELALWRIAEIIHEADLEDEHFDAPEARGLDVLIRGLSTVREDEAMLELTAPLYDGLYEYIRRESMLSGDSPPR